MSIGMAQGLDESAARVLASLMAAEDGGGATKTKVLDELDAWRRIGVSRSRFHRLVQDCHTRIDEQQHDSPWLPLPEMLQIDRCLDRVNDPELRLMVCRLAASLITADGRVSEAERMLYDHTLARWRITTAQVTQAILRDRLH
jgi:hypothetical protein